MFLDDRVARHTVMSRMSDMLTRWLVTNMRSPDSVQGQQDGDGATNREATAEGSTAGPSGGNPGDAGVDLSNQEERQANLEDINSRGSQDADVGLNLTAQHGLQSTSDAGDSQGVLNSCAVAQSAGPTGRLEDESPAAQGSGLETNRKKKEGIQQSSPDSDESQSSVVNRIDEMAVDDTEEVSVDKSHELHHSTGNEPTEVSVSESQGIDAEREQTDMCTDDNQDIMDTTPAHSVPATQQVEPDTSASLHSQQGASGRREIQAAMENLHSQNLSPVVSLHFSTEGTSMGHIHIGFQSLEEEISSQHPDLSVSGTASGGSQTSSQHPVLSGLSSSGSQTSVHGPALLGPTSGGSWTPGIGPALVNPLTDNSPTSRLNPATTSGLAQCSGQNPSLTVTPDSDDQFESRCPAIVNEGDVSVVDSEQTGLRPFHPENFPTTAAESECSARKSQGHDTDSDNTADDDCCNVQDEAQGTIDSMMDFTANVDTVSSDSEGQMQRNSCDGETVCKPKYPQVSIQDVSETGSVDLPMDGTSCTGVPAPSSRAPASEDSVGAVGGTGHTATARAGSADRGRWLLTCCCAPCWV